MLTFCNIQTSNNLNLYGTLHKAQTTKKPIVVIAHGYFSSNRVGPHRLYYQIAESLRNKGYNVIRFDLRGIGESDGYIENVKYDDHVTDLNYVISMFRQRFNDAPIILIAHCIGCNISIPIIEKHPEFFKKVIFVSPYFTTESTLDAFFDKTQQTELLTQGNTCRKGIYADATFFLGINVFREFAYATKSIGPLISVISAKNDQFVAEKETKLLYQSIEQLPIIIDRADHNYLDTKARKDLIVKIAEIIEGHEKSETVL